MPQKQVKLNQTDLTDAPPPIRDALGGLKAPRVRPVQHGRGSLVDPNDVATGTMSIMHPTNSNNSTSMSLAVWTKSTDVRHEGGSTPSSQHLAAAGTNDTSSSETTIPRPPRAMSESELSQLMVHFFSTE